MNAANIERKSEEVHREATQTVNALERFVNEALPREDYIDFVQDSQSVSGVPEELLWDEIFHYEAAREAAKTFLDILEDYIGGHEQELGPVEATTSIPERGLGAAVGALIGIGLGAGGVIASDYSVEVMAAAPVLGVTGFLAGQNLVEPVVQSVRDYKLRQNQEDLEQRMEEEWLRKHEGRGSWLLDRDMKFQRHGDAVLDKLERYGADADPDVYEADSVEDRDLFRSVHETYNALKAAREAPGIPLQHEWFDTPKQIDRYDLREDLLPPHTGHPTDGLLSYEARRRRS